MRISSNSDDSGYSAWKRARALGRKVTIKLDGIEMQQVTMADEELGQICRAVLTSDGKVQINPVTPDEIWMETITGKVEVVLGPKGSKP